MTRRSCGFTLVELLLAMALGGMVIAVVSTAFVVSARSTAETTTRVSTSLDGGFVSTYFVRDVQSSASVTTSQPACGTPPANLVLSMSWSDVSSSEHVDYSYSSTSTGGQLVRHRCGTTTSIDVVARSLVSRPVAACLPNCASADVVRLPLDGPDGDLTASASRRLS